MSQELITSLAVLKVNWDRGHDHIENFVPFVAECMRAAPAREVSLGQLQSDALDRFGLRIPQGALRTILSRAVRKGYANKTRGIYLRNDEALAGLDFQRNRAEALRKHQALVGKLVGFCEKRYQIRWSPQQAEEALAAYLGGGSLPILAAALDGTPLSPIPGSTRSADFLTKAFAVELWEADPEGFDFLETIVRGGMLASVLYFPLLGEAQRRFDHVKVYFDTAFLLRALGLEAAGLQSPCSELLDLLYGLNGQLRCFEHTFEELDGVLAYAAEVLRNPAYLASSRGGVVEHFARSGARASDVELSRGHLARNLRSCRVQVKPRPSYEHRLGVNEERLRAILQEEVGYRREETLSRDLDSLTAIHRLRHGEFPRSLERCRAIFVTTNTALVRASQRFFAEEYGSAAGTVPHCVPDHIFTTLVWLKKPLRAPELPRKMIVADCYAALNPSPALWRRYLDEMVRLRERRQLSEDDYWFLRLSTEARTLLMDSTLGDPEAFTQGTIEEIRAKAYESVRAEAEAALEDEQQRRREVERESAKLENAVASDRKRVQDRIRGLAASVGRYVAISVAAFLVAGLVAGTYLTWPRPPGRLSERWASLLAPLAFLVLTALSISSLLLGTTVVSVKRWVEVQISHWVANRIGRWLES